MKDFRATPLLPPPVLRGRGFAEGARPRSTPSLTLPRSTEGGNKTGILDLRRSERNMPFAKHPLIADKPSIARRCLKWEKPGMFWSMRFRSAAAVG